MAEALDMPARPTRQGEGQARQVVGKTASKKKKKRNEQKSSGLRFVWARLIEPGATRSCRRPTGPRAAHTFAQLSTGEQHMRPGLSRRGLGDQRATIIGTICDVLRRPPDSMVRGQDTQRRPCGVIPPMSPSVISEIGRPFGGLAVDLSSRR